MSVTGACIDFRVLLVGPCGSGKTRFVRYWTGAPSAAAGGDHCYRPTLNTHMHHRDIDVRECVDASAHRVHAIDTPGSPDRHGLYQSALQCRSVGEVDLCVFFAAVPSTEAEQDALRIMRPGQQQSSSSTFDDAAQRSEHCTIAGSAVLHAMLTETATACEAAGVQRGRPIDLLVVDLTTTTDGPAIDLANYTASPSAALLVMDEFSESMIADAIVGMLCATHRSRIVERELQAEREWLKREALASAESSTNKRGPPLWTRPPDAVFRTGHVAPCDATTVDTSLSVVMLGLAAVGRSTFLSAALDDFVLYEYEPTLAPDTGSFQVEFGGRVANVTLHDGPVRGKVAAAQIVLIFVDVFSFSASEDFDALIDGLSLKHSVNVVVGVRGAAPRSAAQRGMVELVSADELSRLAGQVQGAYINNVNPRENNADLLVSVVCQALREQSEQRKRFAKELEQARQRSLPCQAYVTLGCANLVKEATTAQSS